MLVAPRSISIGNKSSERPTSSSRAESSDPWTVKHPDCAIKRALVKVGSTAIGPSTLELKSTEFCLSGEPEHVHAIWVLPLDDEFREGTVLSRSHEKCWQGVAQRGGDDKLGGRDAWTDRSEPGAE